MTATKLETELRVERFGGSAIATYDGLLPFAMNEQVDVHLPDHPELHGLYQVVLVRMMIVPSFILRVVVVTRLHTRPRP